MRPTRAPLGLAVVGVTAVLLTVTLAGCGGSARGRASGPFAWLRPATPPTGWNVARTHGGATLAYPPRWTPIKTDPGTASVALLGADKRIDGYLNATPKQGAETLTDWSRFRPQHNHSEGDRNVRVIAATTTARFRSGRGACWRPAPPTPTSTPSTTTPPADLDDQRARPHDLGRLAGRSRTES